MAVPPQASFPLAADRASRSLTALCCAAMISLSIGLNLLPVFLTTLRTTYGGAAGLTQEQLGRLGAGSFAGLVLGILVTGPLADRWGTKFFAQLGNALIGGSLIAMAFAPSYGRLGIALFILGLGAGMLDMVLSPVVAALNPATRTSALNLLHSFYCIGAAITILAGTLTLHAGYGWRTACLLLLPLPVGLLFAFSPQRFPALATAGVRTRARTLLGRGWFLAALVAIFLGGATELGLAQWLPAYAETALGFPAWVGGAALLLFSVAMAVGRLVIGTAVTRFSPFHLLEWGCGLSVLLLIGGSFLPMPVLALTACIAAGFTGSCLWPTMLAVTADRFPAGGASMFGLLAAAGNAGGICMPWIVGWIADRHDLHWGLALSALAPATMLFFVRGLRRN